jgi:galacturonosyltransferase
LLTNNFEGLYRFRKELIECLAIHHKVVCALPGPFHTEWFARNGCGWIEVRTDRRTVNPVSDLKLLLAYKRIIKEIRPDLVLTYTVKPNIYGGIASADLNIPYIVNITGLGSAITRRAFLKSVVFQLYRHALRRAGCVFFQNADNLRLFLDRGIVKCKYKLIPGSGVNIEQHSFCEYPADSKKTRFLFVGRIMKEKGIDEFLKCAERIKARYPEAQFDIIGWLEEQHYESILDEYRRKGIADFHGFQEDVDAFIERSHVVVNPSYHEGMSNVLLEAAAIGRPVLASDIPGCRETFEDGVTGLAFKPQDADDLEAKMVEFIELPYHRKREMGNAARRKVEEEFDRRIVIDAYMEEIERVQRRLKESSHDFVR